MERVPTGACDFNCLPLPLVHSRQTRKHSRRGSGCRLPTPPHPSPSSHILVPHACMTQCIAVRTPMHAVIPTGELPSQPHTHHRKNTRKSRLHCSFFFALPSLSYQ